MRCTTHRLLLLIALMLLAVAARSDTWALVIGINGYRSGNGLTCAVNDAKEFYDVLTDPKLGGVDKANVRLLTDESVSPTREAILQALDGLVRSVKRGDRLLVFFTGHGICVNTKSYLVPIDGEAGSDQTVASTCLSADDVTSKVSGSGASEILLFIDACRKNAIGAKGAPDSSQVLTEDFAKAFIVRPKVGGAKMTATFYACNLGESAWEWPEKQHGVFTYFCLAGLRGEFPHSKDGVTLSALQEYVGDEVTKHKKQYPQHTQTPWVVVDGQAGSLILSNAKGPGAGTDGIVEIPPPPPFSGRISVSFPGDEDCKAKAALIDALTAQNLDVVDASDRAARDKSQPVRARLVGRQRSEKRTTDAYGMTIHSLDMIVSIKVTDVKAGKSLGSTEATGSMPEIGPESSRESDAADRAAEKLTTYVLSCLQRVKS